MIEKTIAAIEVKIRAAAISENGQRELLQLLAQLKTEIAALEKSNEANAKNQELLKRSMEELRSSVEGFEQSHPKLVQTVNSISNTLSNFGI